MKKFTVLWICFAVFFVDYVIRAIELWPMLALWGIGICLGIINIFLGMRTEEFDVGFSAGRILFAANPAVLEEICFRAVFLAFCGFGAEKLSKGQRFTMWFMMISLMFFLMGRNLLNLLCLHFCLDFLLLYCRKNGILLLP